MCTEGERHADEVVVREVQVQEERERAQDVREVLQGILGEIQDL